VKTKFTVTCPEYDPEWSRTVDAFDACEAAEKIADQVHSSWDYPSYFEFCVAEEGKPPLAIDVEVRAEPVFRGTEAIGRKAVSAP